MTSVAREKRPLNLPVLSSARFVVSRCRSVYFHPEQIEPAITSWGHILSTAPEWRHPCHFFDGTDRSAQWIFVLDVVNHCFWPSRGSPTWEVEYNGTWYSGYWALAAALKRSLEKGLPVTDASFLKEMSESEAGEIFSGRGQIPLFKERLCNLREAGRVLEAEWRGHVVHLLDAAERSAVRAVHLIVSSFKSFQDEAEYGGKSIYFWKRAQLFISDLNSAFENQGRGRFNDMERLTAFADYKLPQVLRELGIISYHPDLAEKIDAGEELEAGSAEEVEIRAVTIWAVEALKNAFGEKERRVTSVQVDNWLWQLGQLQPLRRKPYHRCRTIFY